ncbi:DUF3306 domain-containing protein [Tranquillimonas alkanivorans]|uniref:DUF3306 domain-containing protein n=1 Tax=Tranquillimonas alkanivorans TaxID=441119 RepID=A0A1I5KIA1_9RHOB|nr:DUF3306 domain-containing protein [Tranquillimonas alkanivorans]SFO84794.1 Protein of unknown function [Tranquillimonas alkanivorans]
MSRGDFWSRRKARVAAEERAAAAARVAELEAREEETREAEAREKTDEEILAELELPDPDTLSPGDDFSKFMARKVPERLRRRALRKLWTSNPVLACVDGLNDYDDDYTVAAVSGPAVRTAYQVGKGMLRHVLETTPPETPAEEAVQVAAAPGADTAPAAAEDVPPAEADTDAAPAPVADEVRDPETSPAPAPETEPAPLATGRRMRFTFADAGDHPAEDT